MKFPLSVLPSITIITQLISHLIMLIIVMISATIKYGFFGLSYLGIVYFLFATVSLLFALSLFTSTVSAFVRDFRFVISAVTIKGFVLYDSNYVDRKLQESSELLKKVILYNPVTYLVDGYRNAILFHEFHIATADTAGFWLGVAALFVWGGIYSYSVPQAFHGLPIEVLTNDASSPISRGEQIFSSALQHE